MSVSTFSTMTTIYKTIKVTEETYSSLSKLGTLEDTFDAVIRKLLYAKISDAQKLEDRQKQQFENKNGGAV
jgi:predicted CopG family antitoxin